MQRVMILASGSILALTAPARAQTPALERFHDVLPAQDFHFATPAVALDFDGDGDVDVAAGGPFLGLPAEPKRLWLNDGDAVFTEAAGAFPPTPLPKPSVDLLGADFDGDGLPEVFESRFSFDSRGNDALFHNLGGGVFADASGALPPGGQSTFAVVLDHDLDGDLDLFADGGRERVIENLGGLQFQYASTPLPPGNQAEAAAAGDLDGDGWDDLVLVGSQSRVLLNLGGVFTIGSYFSVGPGGAFEPPVVELADLDGDQDLDAVIGGTDLELGENDGAGSLTLHEPFPSVPWSAVLSIAAGDVDGDQDQDLVVASGEPVLFWPGGASLYRNEGALSFTALAFPNPTEAAASDYQRGLLVDLDGDQDLDYLRSGTRVVLGDGQGAFASLDDGLMWSYDAVLGDLEGDGDPDLFQSSPLRFQRAGAAGLEPPVLLPFPGEALSAGDVDLDGDADLLAGYVELVEPPAAALYLGDGAGGFADGSAGLPAVVGYWESRLADVDGDGDLDGLLRSLIENQGGGTFSDASGLLPALADFRGPEFGDVDGDGDLDLVLAADHVYAPHRALLLRNDGPLGFADVTGQQLAQRGANVVQVGDVDLDGDQDLVFVGEGQDRLQRNDGAGFFTDATAGALPPDGENGLAAALFDPDGDGDLDLYVGNIPGLSAGASSGGRSLLLGNDGAGTFAPQLGALPERYVASYLTRPPAADFDGDGDVDLHPGDPVGLLANTTRHVAWTKPPRLGRPLELGLRGDAGTGWTLLASTGTLELPLGALGTLGVDPAHAVVLSAGMLDGAGHGAAAFAVPADPTLVGASLFWQAIVGAPRRLTNVERTTFTGF